MFVSLINFVEENPILKKQVLKKFSSAPLFLKLFEEINKGNIDPEVLHKTLYPSSKNSKKAFNKLSNRFTDSLCNLMFTVEANSLSYSKLRSNTLKAWRNFSVIKLMLNYANYEAAIHLIESTLRITRKYHINDLKLLLLIQMRKTYSYLQHNEKNIEKLKTRFLM